MILPTDMYVHTVGETEITGASVRCNRGAFSFALAFGFITAANSSSTGMGSLNEYRNYRKSRIIPRGWYRGAGRPAGTILVFLVRIDTQRRDRGTERGGVEFKFARGERSRGRIICAGKSPKVFSLSLSSLQMNIDCDYHAIFITLWFAARNYRPSRSSSHSTARFHILSIYIAFRPFSYFLSVFILRGVFLWFIRGWTARRFLPSTLSCNCHLLCFS